MRRPFADRYVKAMTAEREAESMANYVKYESCIYCTFSQNSLEIKQLFNNNYLINNNLDTVPRSVSAKNIFFIVLYD